MDGIVNAIGGTRKMTLKWCSKCGRDLGFFNGVKEIEYGYTIVEGNMLCSSCDSLRRKGIEK